MEGCLPEYQIKYAVEGNRMSASCVPCKGIECWKRCDAPIIESVEAAKVLKGCKIINGPLEIQLKPSDNAMVELESSLGDIVEIEDYLKISRSPCITSLRFLKNLKGIRGKNLASDKYSLIVFDNPNLRSLLEDNQEIRMKNGKAFFHFNPKLCFSLIEKTVNSSGEIANYEEAKISNGNQVSCESPVMINTEVIDVAASEALINWSPVELNNETSILSYVIFYKETETQNVEAQDESNVCGSDE